MLELHLELQTMFTVVHTPAHFQAFYISWSGEKPKTEKQHHMFVKKIVAALHTPNPSAVQFRLLAWDSHAWQPMQVA